MQSMMQTHFTKSPFASVNNYDTPQVTAPLGESCGQTISVWELVLWVFAAIAVVCLLCIQGFLLPLASIRRWWLTISSSKSHPLSRARYLEDSPRAQSPILARTGASSAEPQHRKCTVAKAHVGDFRSLRIGATQAPRNSLIGSHDAPSEAAQQRELGGVAAGSPTQNFPTISGVAVPNSTAGFTATVTARGPATFPVLAEHRQPYLNGPFSVRKLSSTILPPGYRSTCAPVTAGWQVASERGDVSLAASPSAQRASLDARREALNAKLARHRMSSPIYYNRAMELTRQIEKMVIYPSPYARGRSAYKILSGEPEDAPDGWRNQVEQAFVEMDSEHVGQRVRLDATYLRRGCILLVLEYSSRRRGGCRDGRMRAPELGDVSNDSSSSSCYTRGAGSLAAQAQAASGLQPCWVLSTQHLTAALGTQLVGSGAEIGVQHFAGPTGGDSQLQIAGWEEGPQPCKPGSGSGSHGLGGLSPPVPSHVLILGGPCVLASTDPVRLEVLTIGAQDDRNVKRASSSGHSITVSSGLHAAATTLGAVPPGGHTSCPRVLARYGCLDALPRPCCILTETPYDPVSEGRASDNNDDLGSSDVWDMNAARSGADAESDVATEQPSHMHGQAVSSLWNMRGERHSTRYALQSARHLRISVGPCPAPGLLLLELELEQHATAAEPAVAMSSSPTALSAQEPSTTTAQNEGLSSSRSYLPAPMPVVIVSCSETQREINSLVAVAALAIDGRAANMNASIHDDAATSSASAPAPVCLPGWLLAFLFDLGRCLELMMAAASAVKSSGLECTAAAVSAGTRNPDVTSFACFAHNNTQTARIKYMGGGLVMEHRGVGSACVHSGPPSSTYEDVAQAGPEESDSDSWLSEDVRPASSLEPETEHMVCLAASLTAYACSQGLPATVAYILSSAQHAGIALHQLDEEVRQLHGGLGLGHLAVQGGNAQVLQALVMHAWHPLAWTARALATVEEATAGGASSTGCTALSNACLPEVTMHTGSCQASDDHMNGAYGSPAELIAALSDCAALFVCLGPSGITPLHLMAVTRTRCPELAQVLLSLCPLAAHAWFLVCDEAGSSAAAYMLQAGDWEMHEQCMELLAMEALEISSLGYGGAKALTIEAMSAAQRLVALARDDTPSGSPTTGATIELTTAPARAEQDHLNPDNHGHCSGPPAGPYNGKNLIVATDVGCMPEAPARPIEPSARTALMPRRRRSCAALIAAARCLPWSAPLRGFSDLALEAGFAARANTLALQRINFTLVFYVLFIAGCVQKAPTADWFGLLAVAGPGLSKLLGVGAAVALQLHGTALDVALAVGDVLLGIFVGGTHLGGLPHPQPFEVTSLGMQEALTSLFHCLIHPIMEQMRSPVISLANVTTFAMMEWPMLIAHGWTVPAAVGVLVSRMATGIAVRYGLAVWVRASYLRSVGREVVGASTIQTARCCE